MPPSHAFLAKTGHASFRLRCHAAAWAANYSAGRYDEPGLLLLSATGPDTAVKATRAILHVPEIAAEFLVEHPDNGKTRRLSRVHLLGKPIGYTVSVARLAPGAIHLVALAKLPGLMPELSDEALWAELSGQRYTTPLLREWTPWLKAELLHSGGIVQAGSLDQATGSKPGVLTVLPEKLDELVSAGVRRKELMLDVQ
jgi:hypothetical protein